MTEADIPTDGRNRAGDSALKQRVFVLIFQSRTPAGKLFDVALILAILLSNTLYG